MAELHNHRKIVTDGLVFVVDSGNIRSYSGSGTSVNSMSDLSQTGTLLNGVSFVDNSFEFDGVDDRVDIFSSFSSVSSNTQGTIELWVKPSVGVVVGSEVAFSYNDTSALTYIHFQNTEGKLLSALHNGLFDFWQVRSDDVLFTDNTWSHIVITHDSVTPSLYFDGEPVVFTFDVSANITGWFNDLITGVDNGSLGSRNYNGFGEISHWNGLISPCLIYDRALTPDEVLQNYNANKIRFT